MKAFSLLSADFSSLPQQPPQRPLHLLVPQSVNERVKGGSYNSVQKGYELSLTVGIRAVGLDIDSCDGSIEECYYQEVGPTSAKGFSPGLS